MLLPLLAVALPHAALLSTGVRVYASDACLLHDPGWLHPESPQRLELLLGAMRTEWRGEFGELLTVCEPEVDVTREQVLRVHSPSHIKLLETAYERASGFMSLNVNLDADTVVSRGSEAAASRAAGLVVRAVDDIFSGSEPSRAFVLARPPGHHAEPDRPMGFCLLNNVLIGVAHAQAMHGIGRIAILDFDVHHGNGCATMCADDASRLYASTHQSPCFPSTGEARGRSGTYGGVLSYPLPPGAGSNEFRGAWSGELLPAVRVCSPDAVHICACARGGVGTCACPCQCGMF